MTVRWILGAAMLALLLSGCLGGAGAPASTDGPTPASSMPAGTPHVVVATLDTGTNPFHPCFRRPGLLSPAVDVPDLPADAKPLNLTFLDDYKSSWEASNDSIKAIEDHTLYYVPNTNLLYYGAKDAKAWFVDKYPHGAQASSQIGCAEFGLAAEAYVVILNWYTNNFARSQELTRWAAAQAWIDIIHLNIQDTPNPAPASKDTSIELAIKSGRFVVIAGGNGVQGGGASYPMELSRFNGPPGSLVAGASDNGGYTTFSNLNPHVVMDGSGTRAAAPRSYGTTSFGGTSSASPRTTGYVAHLLYMVREHFGYAGGNDAGVLVALDESVRPTMGPLADGKLTVAELHEVVRKTANPNPHASKWDGNKSATSPPQPVDTPVAVYAKMGYGKLSEHTIGAAFNVTIGAKPMPVRMEDNFYERSEQFRRTWWN